MREWQDWVFGTGPHTVIIDFETANEDDWQDFYETVRRGESGLPLTDTGVEIGKRVPAKGTE